MEKRFIVGLILLAGCKSQYGSLTNEVSIPLEKTVCTKGYAIYERIQINTSWNDYTQEIRLGWQCSGNMKEVNYITLDRTDMKEPIQ